MVRSRVTVRGTPVPDATLPWAGSTDSPAPDAVAVKSNGAGPSLPTVTDPVLAETPRAMVPEPPTTRWPTVAIVVVVVAMLVVGSSENAAVVVVVVSEAAVVGLTVVVVPTATGDLELDRLASRNTMPAMSTMTPARAPISAPRRSWLPGGPDGSTVGR